MENSTDLVTPTAVSPAQKKKKRRNQRARGHLNRKIYSSALKDASSPMKGSPSRTSSLIGGHEGYITVGMYEEGTPGEVFIKMAKEGSTLSGFMDGLALSISVGLQYGVPLKAIVDKLTNTRFEPSGFTENPSHSLLEFRAGLHCALARR